ncbi:DnaJ family domain-containing protein [Microbacterium sp. HJ5]
MSEDPRQAAARYRQERDAEMDASAEPSAESRAAANAVDRAAYVETAIQQAIRRGEFDDLPGAGKPIPGLGESHDPDWWIRRKIQSEQLTGLGPPALLLRVESAELEQRLDALGTEKDVRDSLDDFNRRVIEARRQLQGGPPVVTPTRDVESEVAAWHTRRAAAEKATDAAPPPRAPRRRVRGRWLRRG